MARASVHLDALRGAAALVVLVAHTRVLFFGEATGAAHDGPIHAGGWVLPNYLAPSIGHQAVIVFFVLSGLLVGGGVIRQVATGAFRWADYLSARLTRLWVPLIPLLILGGLLDLATIHYFPSASAAFAARRLSPEIFFGNVAFLQGIAVPYLGSNVPLWSLSFEWVFYLAFPILMLATSWARTSPLKTLAAGALLAGLYVATGPIMAFYFALWCLGAGVAAIPRRSLPSWAAGAGAVAFVGLNLLVWKAHLFPLASDAALAALSAALCYLLLCAEGQPAPRYAAVASFLAGMSYTLYLAHFPIIFLLNHLLGVAVHPWPLDALHGAAVIALLGIVFVICWLLYLAFEARTDAIRALLCKAEMKKRPEGRLTSSIKSIS